jgi:hypothetical protein
MTQGERITELEIEVGTLMGEVNELRAGTELLAKALAAFLPPIPEPAPERPRLRVIGGQKLLGDSNSFRPRGRLRVVR